MPAPPLTRKLRRPSRFAFNRSTPTKQHSADKDVPINFRGFSRGSGIFTLSLELGNEGGGIPSGTARRNPVGFGAVFSTHAWLADGWSAVGVWAVLPRPAKGHFAPMRVPKLGGVPAATS